MENDDNKENGKIDINFGYDEKGDPRLYKEMWDGSTKEFSFKKVEKTDDSYNLRDPEREEGSEPLYKFGKDILPEDVKKELDKLAE